MKKEKFCLCPCCKERVPIKSLKTFHWYDENGNFHLWLCPNCYKKEFKQYDDLPL